MIKKILKNKFTLLLGLVLGMFLGYFYWSAIGCTNGTCPMNSTPLMNILTGGIFAYLIISTVQESIEKN